MPSDKFLLIKAWSYILWSDVEHVLAQLLIAEITGRTPVVYWPTYCLHNGFINTNGFELYFEPVSEYSIFDVAKSEYTYYPPVWDEDNLLMDDPDRDKLVFRNIGEILGRKENVVVGDVYFDIYDLIPYIKKDNPAYGMTVNQIYSYLFHKYIRLKQDIIAEINGFYRSWLSDEGPVLAVHVCAPEKDYEYNAESGRVESSRHNLKGYQSIKDEKLQTRCKIPLFWRKRKVLKSNAPYHGEIKKFIDKYDIKKIFLITNSQEVLNEYKQKYGSMIVATKAKRAEEDEKVKYLDSYIVKRRAGIDILKETYLASMCDFFIGNDFSSLSHAVTIMKDWPEGNAKLLYWEYRRKKYPINADIITIQRRNSPFAKAKKLFKRLLNR